MIVGLNTVDLFPGRERLMPFRTLIEVAKVMNEHGLKAEVLNSPVDAKVVEDYDYDGVKIRRCPRGFDQLSQWVNEQGYDAFFFPSTFRDGLKNLDGLKRMRCKKIAYVPSGVTPMPNALWLARLYGTLAKAWLLEALTPKTLIAKKLSEVGFRDVICLTDYTSKRLGTALHTHTIYAGKDDFELRQSDDSLIRRLGLKGKKFFLFTGAPGQVRGGYVLLEAFDRMVCSEPNAQIIFLMRNDVGSRCNEFFDARNRMKHKSNICILTETLTVLQLKAFIEEAYAVVLPFICIPAEIPLTYYEVLSVGTPVVSFMNAGTTMYLSEGLMLADKISVAGLSDALLRLWRNPEMRSNLSKKGMELMSRHPDWNAVGKMWIDILKS